MCYLCSAALFAVGCAKDCVELFVAAGLFAVAGAIGLKK